MKCKMWVFIFLRINVSKLGVARIGADDAYPSRRRRCVYFAREREGRKKMKEEIQQRVITQTLEMCESFEGKIDPRLRDIRIVNTVIRGRNEARNTFSAARPVGR